MKTPTTDWTWPAAIIGLIFFGMAMTFGLLFASRVDGGPEVIPGYYDKAVAWDEIAATRAASRALGWTVDLEHAENGTLQLELLDRNGEPVPDAEGTLTLTRPHEATFSEVIPFRVDASGTATDLTVSAHGAGLWDVRIDAVRGSDRFVHELRREWSLP